MLFNPQYHFQEPEQAKLVPSSAASVNVIHNVSADGGGAGPAVSAAVHSAPLVSTATAVAVPAATTALTPAARADAGVSVSAQSFVPSASLAGSMANAGPQMFSPPGNPAMPGSGYSPEANMGQLYHQPMLIRASTAAPQLMGSPLLAANNSLTQYPFDPTGSPLIGGGGWAGTLPQQYTLMAMQPGAQLANPGHYAAYHPGAAYAPAMNGAAMLGPGMTPWSFDLTPGDSRRGGAGLGMAAGYPAPGPAQRGSGAQLADHFMNGGYGTRVASAGGPSYYHGQAPAPAPAHAAPPKADYVAVGSGRFVPASEAPRHHATQPNAVYGGATAVAAGAGPYGSVHPAGAIGQHHAASYDKNYALHSRKPMEGQRRQPDGRTGPSQAAGAQGQQAMPWTTTG